MMKRILYILAISLSILACTDEIDKILIYNEAEMDGQIFSNIVQTAHKERL